MAISLSLIESTRHSTPPRILLHGGEKVGKSTFMSQGPDPIFIRTEDGLNGINANAFPVSETFEQVVDAVAALMHQEHNYKMVVIDSADWLERLIHEKVCRDDNVKSIELAGGGYGKGYGIALNHWRTLLKNLDYLNKTKKMAVGIICHSIVVSFNDPEHEPYDRYEMKLHQPKKGTGAKDLLCEWADIIGFANAKIYVNKRGDKGKEVKRGIASGESNKLNLIGSPAFVAGNRYGLPPQLDLNWNDFANALKKSFNQSA